MKSLSSKVRNHNYESYLCKGLETEAKIEGNKGGSRQKCCVEKCDGVFSLHASASSGCGLVLRIGMHLFINQYETVKFRGRVRGLEKRK